MDSAYAFSKFVVEMSYSQLPETVVNLVKKDVLDSLGNILAGSSDPVIEPLRQVVLAEKSGGTSTTAVYGDKMSAGNAAFINATMGFAIDYDDIHEPAVTHMGVTVLSAALAVAQQEGSISGKEIICAISVGLEIISRLGMYMVRRNPSEIMGGWDYACLLGYFSAAATAAKLLKLSEEQVHHAFGIAYHQASGTSISAKEQAETKLLGPGFAARGGIFSAQLAKAGLTGAKSVFDGTPLSFATQYNNGCDSAALTDGLGSKWEVLGLGFKAYPCCRLLHRQIDAALELVERYDIQPEEIVKIQAEVCPMLGPMIEHKPDNFAPPTKLAAQFSIPWTVACAIVRRRVDIDAFEEDARQDTCLQGIAARLHGVINPACSGIDIPAELQVYTTRGIFRTMTSIPRGAPQHPLSEEMLQAKFFDCAAHAKYEFENERLEHLSEIVWSLECYQDLSKLFELL